MKPDGAAAPLAAHEEWRCVPSFPKKGHGTWQARDTHPRAQLTASDVLAIRLAYAANKPGKYVKRGTREGLAKKYGVKVSLIKDIVQGRCWAGVA